VDVLVSSLGGQFISYSKELFEDYGSWICQLRNVWKWSISTTNE